MKKTFKVFVISAVMMVTCHWCYALEYNTYNYIVQSGDSLWKIAVKNEVGVSDLVSVNPQINNPNNIIAGSMIKVPDLTEIKKNEDEVIRLVNVERTKRGLKPLVKNWQLSRVARIKSEDMRDKNYFSHTSPTYGSPFDMMKKFGFKYFAAGENIAKGQRTPKEVMNSWMNSTGHRNNILNPNFNEIGVGFAKGSNNMTYWTQMFIKR